MKKWFGKFLFKLYGWKLVGRVPQDVKKYVLIAAPHTSNMDFFLAMPTMWLLGVPGKFLIKREHTDAFYGGLITFLGGIGVDRKNKSLEFVEQLKTIVSSQEELALLFTPEGTRKAVSKWKTGFYRVAMAVEVPIVLAYANYETKEVHLGEVYTPTGDFETDFNYLEAYYKNIPAKVPAYYNPVIYERKSS